MVFKSFLRVALLLSHGRRIDTTVGEIEDVKTVSQGGRTEILRDFHSQLRKPSIYQVGYLPMRLHCFPFIFKETPQGPTLQFTTLLSEQCVPCALASIDQKLCRGRKRKKKKTLIIFSPPRAEMFPRSVERTGRFRYRCVRETRVRLMERERELIRPLKDASDRREADRTSSSSFINHTGGPRGRGSTMHLFKSGTIKT